MKILTYILFILLLISICFNFKYYKNPIIEKEEIIIEKVDTIIIDTIVYDTVYFKNVEYITRTINDTIWIENKDKVYKDSTPDYDLTINAVKLNSYQLNIHKSDTITYTKEIIKNVYNKKKQHFNHGISVGLGYGIINKSPDIFIGYSVMYSF